MSVTSIDVTHIQSAVTSIPDFEGQEVSFTRAKVAGTATQEIGDRCFPIDSTVKLVVECRVQGVNHDVDQKTGKLQRVHSLKVLDMMLIDWGLDMDALRDALSP